MLVARGLLVLDGTAVSQGLSVLAGAVRKTEYKISLGHDMSLTPHTWVCALHSNYSEDSAEGW